MTRQRSLVLTTALLIALAGCGGGGSGGGTASGGGATSTVSGNISNTSTAMRLSSPPTMLARVLHFFSPVTEAFAGRTGIHVSVGGVETDTDANGFFVLTGPFSGAVTVSFGAGNRTFTLQVDVPAGGTVVLRDVDLRDDGTAHAGGSGVKVVGTIASADCSSVPNTLTVALGNQNVIVDLGSSTLIKVGDQVAPGTCQDLANGAGQPVRVDAEVQPDGSLLADQVKIRPSMGEEHVDEVEFHGAVTALACPASITVARGDGQSVTVNLTSSTEFEGVADCSGLAIADNVEVEGTLANGEVTASEVQVETPES